MVEFKIVLVPFPFDDFSVTKVRPAICLTNEISSYNHIIIAFITSNTSNKRGYNQAIRGITPPRVKGFHPGQLRFAFDL